MAEMGDVIGGEVISSDWGNDIRDRTIQRYATAAARTTEHGSPIPGDLSFLEDTGLVYVYYSGAWQLIYAAALAAATAVTEVDGSASANAALTASFATMASVALTIPASWSGWSMNASASWLMEGVAATATTASFKLRIDGDESPVVTISTAGDVVSSNSHGHRDTGFATGPRTVTVQGKRNGSTAVQCNGIYLYARAYRTA